MLIVNGGHSAAQSHHCTRGLGETQALSPRTKISTILLVDLKSHTRVDGVLDGWLCGALLL
jgi:hypothetical protein